MGNRQRPKKYKGATGYTLHSRRLEYTGTDATRTIKYPLVFTSDEVEHRLADMIEADYVAMNGPVNIDAWLNGRGQYSLMDFWVDALRVGGVFQPTTAATYSLAALLQGEKRLGDKAFEALPHSWQEKFDKEGFIKTFIESSEVRTGSSTKQSLFNKHVAALADEYKDDPQTQKDIERLTDARFIEGREHQAKALAAFFGISKTYFTSSKEREDITFLLLPELPLKEDLAPIEAIDRVGQYANQFTEEFIPFGDFVGFGGTNYPAFSNFFGAFFPLLHEGDIESLADRITAILPQWEGKRDDLIARLQWLAERARRLPEPQFAKSWAEYRTVFGGKLQGWYSNYENQRRDIAQQIKKDETAIDSLIARVRSYQAHDAEVNVLEEFHEYLTLGTQMLAGFEAEQSDAFESNMLAYQDVRSRIRTLLNQVVQKTDLFQKEKETFRSKRKNVQNEPNVADVVTEAEKALLERLRVVPAFFGGSKAARYEKYAQLPHLVQSGMDTLDAIEAKLRKGGEPRTEVTPEYFKRQLDILVRRAHQANSNKYTEKIQNTVREITGTFPKSDREAFFVSGYKRRKVTEIPLSLDAETARRWLGELIERFDDPANWTKLTDGQRVDLVEMKKLRMAWLLHLYEGVQVDVGDVDVSPFEKASGFLRMVGTSLSGNTLSWFVNSYILSEIKGAIMQMSRKEFTVRSVIQRINSDEYFPLVYTSPTTNAKEAIADNPERPTILRSHSHRFGFAFPALDTEADVDPATAILWRGKNKKTLSAVEMHPRQKHIGPVGWLRTSKYQLQFLEWLLGSAEETPLKKKGQVHLTRMEPSLILERTYQAQWDLEKNTVSLAQKEQRIFMSQPFQLHSAPKRAERKRELKQRSRYLGIDVGEYGIGWAVFNGTDADHGEVEATGFFHEPNLRHIRDYVGLLKERQMRGTFGVPSTKLERLRDQASHAIRNRIHDIAKRYDATIVYEHSISNFETGSARVSNVYRTIKTADVYSETDADRAVKEEVWGKNSIDMGTHLSAYGTSQTCTQCGFCVLEDVRDGDTFSVVERNNGILTLEGMDGLIVYGYSEDADVLKEDTYSGRIVRTRLTQDFMRPPSDSHVLRMRDVSVPLGWTETRGNSAIFVCPHCHYVADADVQAAVNIAYKGLLYGSGKKDGASFFAAVKEGTLTDAPVSVDMDRIEGV